MSHLIEDLVVTLVWLVAIVLLVVRHKELRGLLYGLTLTDDGLTFWYRLGIYAGTVTMIRDMDVKEPQLTGNVLGWRCRFPVRYTNKEMCTYIREYAPQCSDKQPHSKDLWIFNEVVNRNNNALISINCQIFAFDNSDGKGFY
jgi:hypothetical protein